MNRDVDDDDDDDDGEDDATYNSGDAYAYAVMSKMAMLIMMQEC